MIFQDPLSSLHPFYRIGDQLVEAVQAHHDVSKAAALDKAVELLRLVGIPQPKDRVGGYPHEFSGGMRQRVMIAMALINEPKLLIADEPTTALDVTVQAQILELMIRLKAELNTSIVFITHDLGVVAEMADDIAVMYAGRIVEFGPKEAIFESPQHPYTWGLLGSIPKLDDQPRRAAGAGQRPPAVADQPARRVLVPPALPVRARGAQEGRADARAGQRRRGPQGRVPARRRRPGADLGGPAGGQAPRRGARRRDGRRGGCMTDRLSGAAATDESRAAAHVGGGEVLYEIRDLKKHFPLTSGLIFRKQVGAVHAVDGVSFDVKRGETLGLVGESGCGKSTTGRLLLRLLDPTSGSIKFEGQEIADIKPKELVEFRRDAQMIFQDPYSSLNPRKTVGSIIGEPFSIHGMKTGEGERRKAVQELMDTVGLNPEHYNRYPHEFSGGQRQRIGVARAIALKPKLIVADEPVSALDVSIQAQVLNLLRELQRDLGLTLIFIAHDLSVVRHMCDRVAVMYLGKIVELASSDQLYGHPRHPYTGALMSAVPIADPKLAAVKKRQILAGDVPSPTNPPPACRFHTRCWKAQDVCRQDEPMLEVKDGGNVAACHFPLSDAEVAERVPTSRGV